MHYLSSIMDLYNGEIVAYTIGKKQDKSLVLHTLNQLDLEKGCLLHSDQGSVYTSRDYYIACHEKSITRSMSRKATPADNACIEYLHSSLTSEAFYPSTEYIYSNTIVIDIIKNYIKNYNENRIQLKLGYLSPVQLREQADFNININRFSFRFSYPSVKLNLIFQDIIIYNFNYLLKNFTTSFFSVVSKCKNDNIL